MSLATRLSDLAFAIGTDMKQFRVWMTGSSSGDLNGLTTAVKSDFVAAINEVNAKPTGGSGSVSDATTVAKGIIEVAELAEVAAGVDGSRAVTPAGVRQERVALKAEILGVGIPAALDTLDELAAALGDDANFAATVTTALGERVLISDLGNPDTDLVAVYSAAKA